MKETMSDQPESETSSPVQDVGPSSQPGTSTQKDDPNDSQPQVVLLPRPRPGTTSQQDSRYDSQPPVSSPQPGTSSQQDCPNVSQPPAERPKPQPGTSSQRDGPNASQPPAPRPSPQPGASSQLPGPSYPQPPRNPSKNQVCPFNLSGTCRHGNICRFSHAYRNMATNTDNSITRHSTTRCPRHQIQLQDMDTLSRRTMDPKKWVQAPEFVPPTWVSWAEETKSDDVPNLCPNLMFSGVCPFSASACPWIHGDTCEVCQMPVLDPHNANQRREHKEQCEAEMMRDMENAFAVQRSATMTCAICQEIVWEKDVQSQRLFGILQNCLHAFCLTCIRKWRQSRRGNEEPIQPAMATRQCPVCREHSYYFVPSHLFPEGEEGKQKLIYEFKEAVSKKPCRYFKVGSVCTHAESCFYLHSEDIRNQMMLTDQPPPKERRKDVMENISVWEEL